MKTKKKIIIIPTCTDFNRGDQALVLETRRIIDQVYGENETYMMSTGETIQCEALGLKKFEDILKHPSRFDKKGSSNVSYGIWLKIRWGFVAIFDLLVSILIINNVTRKAAARLLAPDSRYSLKLYEESESVFVKGGGFLHDYSKGLIGVYSIYYQLFHIKLALNMGKKVYIMPNSYGPFKNSLTSRMVNKVLDRCVFVAARESVSANATTNGLNRSIPLYPDLGFFLELTNREQTENYLEQQGVGRNKSERLVAMTVRPYRFYSYDNPAEKYKQYKQAFVDLCTVLTSQKYTILLVVHTRADNDHENDRRCVNEIYAMLTDTIKEQVVVIDDDSLNCYDLKAIYGYCDYVIGTRFHSVIFAMEQGVPCIAVTYGGNKGQGIMRDIGLGNFAIDIASTTTESLVTMFDRLVAEETAVKKLISVYMKSAKKRYKALIAEVEKS